MLINKKTLLILITIFTIILISSTNVQAIDWSQNTDIDFNNRLTEGKDIAYYIVPGNTYTASIPQAVSKLRYPSGMWNPIVLTPTSVQKQSKMDLYQYSSYDGNNAYTEVFRKNSSGQYYQSVSEMDYNDWVYGNIHLNYTYLEGCDKDLRSTIILHEMLHVYGCKDVKFTDSIMYFATSIVRGMTSDANNVLVQKYNY